MMSTKANESLCVFIFNRIKKDEGQGKESVTLNMMSTKAKERLVVYFQQNKKGEGQGQERCHAKSMMNNRVNERLKYTLSFYRLGRTWRKKYEGRS